MTATVTSLGKSRVNREPVWLSPTQVCARVPGMTEEILADRRKKGLKPDWRKPSLKTVVYEQHEVDEWVESTKVVGRDERKSA